MSQSGKRIAILSDGPNLASGYGNIALALGIGLQDKGYSVRYVSLQQVGEPLEVSLYSHKFVVYEGNNTLSMQRAMKDVDVVIHIRDAFYYSSRYFATPYQVKPLTQAKVVLWTPVQAEMLPDDFLKACMYDCDYCIAMNEWSKNVLMSEGVPYNRLGYIYPSSMVVPPQVKGLFSSPTVGSVGVIDQYRKNYPALVAGFAKFRIKHRDWNLYIHAPSSAGSADLVHFSSKYGIKITYPANVTKTWGFDRQTMANIMSSLEMYATTSIAEGFNLPLLEASYYVGRAVASDIPAHREIASKFFRNTVLIPTKRIYPTAWSFEYAVDPEDVASAMEEALSKEKDPNKDIEAMWKTMSDEMEKIINKL